MLIALGLLGLPLFPVVRVLVMVAYAVAFGGFEIDEVHWSTPSRAILLWDCLSSDGGMGRNVTHVSVWPLNIDFFSGATWMPLKGALHTHSTCSDGELPWEEVLRVHREQDFDFVALTDHDFLKKPNAYADVPDEYEGMLVYKGVEKTVFAKGYVHVNIIPGVDELLHIFNHPAEYELTFEQTLDRIARVAAQMPVHAVEVSAKGFYTPEFDVPAIDYPKVVSDDSHIRTAIGRAWVEVDAPRQHDAVLRAIKAGEARLVYTYETHQAPVWKH